MGFQDSISVARLPAKTVDEAVGRDLERQGVKARRLTMPRIVQKLGQAFLGDILGDILGMAATPDIDQHRMSHRTPIGIREFGVSRFAASLCSGFDPKSYGEVILTHAARLRCGL